MSASAVKTAVLAAHARVTDKKAMGKLLEPLPQKIAADVRQLVSASPGKAAMRYDDGTKKAFWIEYAKDGVLSIWTFAHIDSVEIAAALWSAFDDSKPLAESDLHRIYTEVTGHAVEIIGTRN